MSKEPMYVEIFNTILNRIETGAYKTGDMLPTEQELEKEFFVSRVTVRKATQLLEDEGLIERISGRGTYITATSHFAATASSKKKLIGLIMSNAEHSFGTELILAAEQAANQLGYTLILKNSYDSIDNEKKAISELLQFGVSGLIIQPIREEYYNNQIIKLHMKKFPIVFTDRDLPGFPIPCVATDNFKATIDATNHIFSMGHQNITLFCIGSKNTNTISERIAGFQNAFYENQVLFTDWNIFKNIMSPIDSANGDSYENDIEEIKKFLRNNPQITCLFASEYIIASMLMKALDELGKKVPDDYSIAMFDNVPSLFSSDICHIRQNEWEIGKTAIETLIRIINNKTTKNKIAVQHELIRGNSIKRI